MLDTQTTQLVDAVARLMKHADERRRLGVERTPTPPRTPPGRGAFGAEGIGLARTEHMFLGDRKDLVVRLVLAVR